MYEGGDTAGLTMAAAAKTDALLTDLCQYCVRHRDALAAMIADDSGNRLQWAFRVAAVMKACLRSFGAGGAKDNNVNPQLRMLEVFSRLPQTYSFLVARDVYYSGLRELCDARIPPSLEEETANPPTPMSDLVVTLVMNPLVHVNDNKELRYVIYIFVAQIRRQTRLVNATFVGDERWSR